MTIQDLQTEVDKLKAKGKTWLIVAGVALLLVIILLITVFRPKKADISELEYKIELLQFARQQQDSLIVRLDEAYQKNRKTENILKEHYEKIDSSINHMDRDELRRAISNY